MWKATLVRAMHSISGKGPENQKSDFDIPVNGLQMKISMNIVL
jgi:hypothetical protein